MKQKKKINKWATAILLLLTWSSAIGQQAAPEPFSEVSTGTAVYYPGFTSQWVDARNIEVWLPAEYNDSTACNVLYMHDGQMLFDAKKTWNKQEWGVDEILGELIGSGEIEPTLVVGIWNNGPKRHSEYFPQKVFELLPEKTRDSLLHQVMRNPATDLFTTEIESDNYLRFIAEELKPFIDSTYATHPERESTFIAGSSMGGLISLYAISEYPEVFGAAACLSTHWPGVFSLDNNPIPEAMLTYLDKDHPPADSHRLYFDHGTATLDSLYPEIQEQVDSLLISKGYNHTNFLSIQFTGEEHSERAWRSRLHFPLRFLLDKGE